LNADEGDPQDVTSSTRCFTGTVVWDRLRGHVGRDGARRRLITAVFDSDDVVVSAGGQHRLPDHLTQAGTEGFLASAAVASAKLTPRAAREEERSFMIRLYPCGSPGATAPPRGVEQSLTSSECFSFISQWVER
jgi:hypothetical protein